ncbi:MAG: 2-amino-4-hydroxy-6-hydroxymethyldihydropteridine diphosphokinase [Rhodospirillaceae bacterium]|nr:2-amino-4-hydroxy-6-hydroxymethyldihydropteridine diphosphokinase [Rhodospirillaceae bacterium]
MILIAIGSNLPSRAGPPLATCRAALAALDAHDVKVKKVSRWYESAPVPASDQPNFVNGVAVVGTHQSPRELLRTLHAVEVDFARERGAANAARTLDLDLLDYDGQLREIEAPLLPHPRLHQRVFVLLPLRDVAPDWRHPGLKKTVSELILALGPGAENRGIWPIPGPP